MNKRENRYTKGHIRKKEVEISVEYTLEQPGKFFPPSGYTSGGKIYYLVKNETTNCCRMKVIAGLPVISCSIIGVFTNH